MDVHKYEGADGGYCTAPVYRGQECGFPATNRKVHAPGAAAAVPPLRAVPTHVRTGLDAPATSYNAAEGARLVRGALGRAILVDIAIYGPSTDDQIEHRTGKAHSSVSSARNGLVEKGFLVPHTDDNGATVTRPTRVSGRAATVWALTDAGAAAAAAARQAVSA